MATCPPFDFSDKYYHTSGNSCVRQTSFFAGKAVLNQSVGYSVILGFGAFFAFFTSFLVWLEKRYVGARHTSEWFNTAGRNVKTGLIASVIVSQWTWAATILQSSNVAWQYGVSGPFWYASGATIQVLLFGVMAIEIKRKAPHAHTVCEIVKARWGTAAHLVFLVFCFMTNIIVTAMLLLGGSAVVNALTGVNIYAASFLIPLGVIVYTLAGGLKATFLASYIHSVIVHLVLVIFVYLVYTSSSELGSPSVVYRRLAEVSSRSRMCQEPISHNGQACGPVSGNYQGSYLTMLSSGGLVFGIINIVGNFGTVFVDNGYWVSAIAARPSSTHKGYLLGGLVWFAVPFSLATSLGLGALALDLPLTASEASHGLVPPATAMALMGKGGSVLLLTMLFMAVTSAGSSELIAVSSLCTYDIYRTYITIVEKEKSELAVDEFKEEKLISAKKWIVKWGVGFTFVIVVLWPLFSLPAKEFSKGYFTFWAIVAIAWGTIGSAVIIVLPLAESWQTIQSVMIGMFTNDKLVEKIDELNLKLETIIKAVPDAERIYLLEKGKIKKDETSMQMGHIS
ncbi:putative sodium/solute symporter, sodium/glucose symporter superfamily [Helianthus annuus]|nr:putative sodium/solute symporter, sodium/glucose symporter superfamily [Helianthus annuus]